MKEDIEKNVVDSNKRLRSRHEGIDETPHQKGLSFDKQLIVKQNT